MSCAYGGARGRARARGVVFGGSDWYTYWYRIWGLFVGLSEGRQRELFRKHARQAAMEMYVRLGRDMDSIVGLAERRVFGPGLSEYGDSSWWLRGDGLDFEQDCELADGVFYGVVRSAWRAGDLS